MQRRCFFKQYQAILLAWAIVSSGAGLPLTLAAQKDDVARFVNGWRVGEPVTYENLSLFPLWASRSSDTSGFVTLDEALASGDAVVTERGGEILRRRRGTDPDRKSVV